MAANNQKMSRSKILVESALMVAVATVLSLVKLLDLPYGGAVTVGCMLPVIIISYRHGLKWGTLTGFVFAVIEQLLGLKNLSYVTTWQSIVAVILLDYLIAFMVIGWGGLFRKHMKQPTALFAGTIFVCLLRYCCHVLSGATVWAGLSIPTNAALLYSLGYNATYMLPETIVTAVLAYYLGSMLDFGSEQIVPYGGSSVSRSSLLLKGIGGLIFAAAIVIDAILIFSKLQNAETGAFDATGFAAVNLPLLLIITLAGVVCFVILIIVANRQDEA